MHVYHVLFIHLSISKHLGLLGILAVVNDTAVNKGVKTPLQDTDFISFGCTPRSGITRTYGNSILSFLRNLHTIFSNGYTNLHSYQQCKRVPFPPHPLQHLLFVDFWWWPFWLVWGSNIIVGLICISLIISNIDHLFMCLLAICVSSLNF